jgi:hypothetical protein
MLYERQKETFGALSSGLKGLCHEMIRFKGLQNQPVLFEYAMMVLSFRNDLLCRNSNLKFC